MPYPFRQLFNYLAKHSTRRRLCTLSAIVAGFFLANLIFSSYFLEQYLREDVSMEMPARQYDLLGSNCTDYSTDPYTKSALMRMKTAKCRRKLADLVCQISDAWPVHSVENGCREYFDRASIRYEGCYQDSTRHRVLNDYKYLKETSNSVYECTQACLRAGFLHAGVEYGVECFCGNGDIAALKSSLIDDERCMEYTCPKGNQAASSTYGYCGGYEAIAIYSTGVLTDKHRVYPTFIPLPSDPNERMAKVRILFLLQLNGRNSRQVKRMIRSIYSPLHLYYVHVDASQQYMFSEIKKVEHTLLYSGVSNFKVPTERFHTSWGATTLLDMFLHVIETTLKLGGEWSKWDYILNLSEADMPLLPLEELEHNLRTSRGSSFLSSHGYNTAKFIKKQGYNYYFMTCERRTWRIASRYHFPHNLRLDGGSDWVIIHRDLAEYAIGESDLPKHLRALFSTILLPLESFFHTLAINSEFCTRVLYKNLRFTYWNRKQGCRCGALKKVVDWCGCSPLVVRGAEELFNTETCQHKLHFFGRKFDSLINADSVAVAEHQANRLLSRNRNALSVLREHTSFNSTWITTYKKGVDGKDSGGRGQLLEQWAETIYNKGQLPELSGCAFNMLDEISIYKASSISNVALVITAVDTCGSNLEMFVKLVDKSEVISTVSVFGDKGSQYAVKRIEYGMGLDLKEEIFRNYPPIATPHDEINLLWQWATVEQSTVHINFTSPVVKLRFHLPGEVLLKDVPVNAYDSINGAQQYTIDLTLFNVSDALLTGHWHVEILNEAGDLTVASIRFPVFPTLPNLPMMHELTADYYDIVDYCYYIDTNGDGLCSVKDPKSEISSSWLTSLRNDP